MNVPDSTRLQPSGEAAPTRPVDLTHAQVGDLVARPENSGARPQQPVPPATDAPDYSRAPEVAEFVAHLRKVSEVRSDVIKAVRELLSAGQYDTRRSAEATAKRLLGQSG